MNLKKRLQLFETLRDEIRGFLISYPNVDENNLFYFQLLNAIEQQSIENKWFIPNFILQSLEAIVEMLDQSEWTNFFLLIPISTMSIRGKMKSIGYFSR